MNEHVVLIRRFLCSNVLFSYLARKMFYWIVSGPSVVHPDMDIAILPRPPDEWRLHISNCLGVLFFYLSLGFLVDECVSRSLHREGIHSIVYLTDASLRINLTSRYCYLLCHQLKRCFDFVSLKYLISRNFRRNPSKCFQITEHWMNCHSTCFWFSCPESSVPLFFIDSLQFSFVILGTLL